MGGAPGEGGCGGVDCLGIFKLPVLPAGKAFVAKKPDEIPEHEQVILEPELEEALKNASDAEMCDIAGSDPLIPPGHLGLRSDYSDPPSDYRLRNSRGKSRSSGSGGRFTPGLFSVRITAQITAPAQASPPPPPPPGEIDQIGD